MKSSHSPQPADSFCSEHSNWNRCSSQHNHYTLNFRPKADFIHLAAPVLTVSIGSTRWYCPRRLGITHSCGTERSFRISCHVIADCRRGAQAQAVQNQPSCECVPAL